MYRLAAMWSDFLCDIRNEAGSLVRTIALRGPDEIVTDRANNFRLSLKSSEEEDDDDDVVNRKEDRDLYIDTR